MTSRDRVWWLVLVTCVLLAVALVSRAEGGERPRTVEGKTVAWWAAKAKQARKDANARAVTVRRLRRTLAHDPSVTESIRLATIAYPALTEARSWRVIKHESWMVADPVHAYNHVSVNGCHAVGLTQILDCTFRSTPYGRAGLNIYSPYVQMLTMGWMHSVGRGCEWAIGPEC